MAKGKRGPRPADKSEPPPHTCTIEEDFIETLSQVSCTCGFKITCVAEEGKQYVLHHQDPEKHPLPPKPPDITEPAPAPLARDLRCLDCFADKQTTILSSAEMEEHFAAVGHSHWERYESPAVQAALFSPPAIVHRSLERELTEEEKHDIRINIATEFEQLHAIEEEKEAAVKIFNEKIKPHKDLMDALAKQLLKPKVDDVEAMWHIEATERVLRRCDSTEELERRPLTAEDRAALETPPAVAAPAKRTRRPSVKPDTTTMGGVTSEDITPCDYCGHPHHLHKMLDGGTVGAECQDTSFNIQCDCKQFQPPYEKKAN